MYKCYFKIELSNGLQVNVLSYKIHPSYGGPRNHLFEIAIVEISPVYFTDSIKALCLPKVFRAFKGQVTGTVSD